MIKNRVSIRGQKMAVMKGLPKDQTPEAPCRGGICPGGAPVDCSEHAVGEYIQTLKMASIQEFVSGVGHDLRSGLTLLSCHLARLRKNVLDTDEVVMRLKHMEKVLDDMGGLLFRLDSLSADGTGEDTVPWDLSIETERVMEALLPTIPAEVNLHTCASSKRLPVMLAQGDVWTILVNLVSNAVDAMPEGGDLLVNTDLVHIDHIYCIRHGNARCGEFAVLRVIDHGTGIPAEILPRIFDPLFSTKRPTQEKKRRGWGLSTLYSLASRRGGWIDVTSKEGEGTAFEVFLPLCNP